MSGGSPDSNPADFLWLLLPLAVLAASSGGTAPAGLAVGFAICFTLKPFLGPLEDVAQLIFLDHRGQGRSPARRGPRDTSIKLQRLR